jgi:uncharacterized coiled-coil DUF342 family protein
MRKDGNRAKQQANDEVEDKANEFHRVTIQAGRTISRKPAQYQKSSMNIRDFDGGF